MTEARSPAYQARADTRQPPRPAVTVPTPRELEILLTCAEHGTKAAPDRLGISTSHAKNTLTRLYAKLGAHGMAHAILILQGRP